MTFGTPPSSASMVSSPPLRICILAALLLCLGAPASVRAADNEVDVQLRHGEDGSHFKSDGFSVRLGPAWLKDLGSWKGSLRPELEMNHFRYSGPATGQTSLNEIGGIGMFRLTHDRGGMQPYAEIGLGLALLSHDHIGNKELSTHYQFSEHIGVGLEFARKWFVGWRFSHYSNADIETPNDGLDMHQVVFGGHF